LFRRHVHRLKKNTTKVVRSRRQLIFTDATAKKEAANLETAVTLDCVMHFSCRHDIATCFEQNKSFRSIIKKMTKILETKKRQNIISEFLKKGRTEVAKIIDKMLIKMGSVYYIYI